MRRLVSPLALLSLSLAPACVSHSRATDLAGVNGVRGVPIEYQTTTSWALNGLFIFPLVGDASVNNTVHEFAQEASERGDERLRIVQTSSTTYWFIFPPISFFVHPVKTTVEGDVE